MCASSDVLQKCGRKCVVDVGVVVGWSFPYVSINWAVVGEIVWWVLLFCVESVGVCDSHVYVVL